MHFETYDYVAGDPISQVLSLDFGDLIQSQHCSKPIVFRAMADTEVDTTNFTLFLQDKGLWKDSVFGYFTAHDFTSSIEAGSAPFSTHTFVESPDATSLNGPYGVPIPFSDGASDYIWLDVQVFQTGTAQSGTVYPNYRIFYDAS